MTTVVVVRKAGQVAIAGDSLVTFGDTRLPHGYEDNDKLFKVGDSWIGMAGTTDPYDRSGYGCGQSQRPVGRSCRCQWTAVSVFVDSES